MKSLPSHLSRNLAKQYPRLLGPTTNGRNSAASRKRDLVGRTSSHPSLQLFALYHANASEIVKEFPGRSEGACKFQYYAHYKEKSEVFGPEKVSLI
jgi:hypothetical protein